eukprot:4672718-Pyramimonas_sp.AAC.1
MLRVGRRNNAFHLLGHDLHGVVERAQLLRERDGFADDLVCGPLVAVKAAREAPINHQVNE